MSWLFSTLYDRMMMATETACLGSWRDELLSTLSGSVLEIGAGTGVNLARYSSAVTKLALSEPDPHMRAKLEQKVSRSADSARVRVHDAGGELLPFPNDTFDAVVSTLVLCSVEHPQTVVREAKRVLKPGGALVFLEHVAAEEGSPRFAWQRRIEPFWVVLAHGCHLTRRTLQTIEESGFVLQRVERASMRKAPPFVRPTVRGIARKPG